MLDLGNVRHMVHFRVVFQQVVQVRTWWLHYLWREGGFGAWLLRRGVDFGEHAVEPASGVVPRHDALARGLFQLPLPVHLDLGTV